MASLNIVAIPNRKDDAGTVPLYLRIAHNSDRCLLSLGLRVEAAVWDSKRQVLRSKRASHERVNQYLADVNQHIHAVLYDLRDTGTPLTAARIKRHVARALDGEQGSPDDFMSFARTQEQRYRMKGQVATAKRHKCDLNKFEDFLERTYGTTRLPLSGLTIDVLKDFERDMYEYSDNQQNTVAKTLKCLRTIYRKAFKRGLVTKDPFRMMTISETSAKKEGLTREQFQMIRNVDLLRGTVRWHARNMFCFAVYTQGPRFWDLICLRWSNVAHGRLRYVMHKNDKVHEVILRPEACEILAQYEHRRREDKDTFIFPLLDRYDLRTEQEILTAVDSRNTHFNIELKKVAKAANVDVPLSSHMARHTFSRLALDNGWTVRKLSASLRHSSLSTTESYIQDLRGEDLDDDMENMRF